MILLQHWPYDTVQQSIATAPNENSTKVIVIRPQTRPIFTESKPIRIHKHMELKKWNKTIYTVSPSNSMNRKYAVETKCNKHEANIVRTVNPHDLKYECFNSFEFVAVYHWILRWNQVNRFPKNCMGVWQTIQKITGTGQCIRC